MKFLLDENVPISIKDVIHDLGFDVFTLHDFDMLGIQNGEVAKLALKEKAFIITFYNSFRYNYFINILAISSYPTSFNIASTNQASI